MFSAGTGGEVPPRKQTNRREDSGSNSSYILETSIVTIIGPLLRCNSLTPQLDLAMVRIKIQSIQRWLLEVSMIVAQNRDSGRFEMEVSSQV